MSMSSVQPTTVFVIDDSPINLKVFSRFISNLGWQIFTAVDGETGIAEICRILPDIIVLDVMMPGIDGFEVCRRLKQIPETKEIPIIFLSALTDSDSTVRALELGAMDYIHKPFRQEEILSRLKLQLRLSQADKALAKKNQELETQIQKTEQVTAALMQSKTNFSVAFDQSPDPIFIYGCNSGSIMDINQQFCEIFG